MEDPQDRCPTYTRRGQQASYVYVRSSYLYTDSDDTHTMDRVCAEIGISTDEDHSHESRGTSGEKCNLPNHYSQMYQAAWTQSALIH